MATPSETPAARDVAATKRSYLFVSAASVVAWLVLVVAVGGATGLSHGASRDAVYAVAGISGLLLCGWLAFLAGLKRRDLGRIERAPERYDRARGDDRPRGRQRLASLGHVRRDQDRQLQERVREGEPVRVDKRADEVGASISFAPVLLVDGDKVLTGPALKGAAVTAKVVGAAKGPKIRGLTYKPKSRQRRRWGHRQQYTTVEITKISAKG